MVKQHEFVARLHLLHQLPECHRKPVERRLLLEWRARVAAGVAEYFEIATTLDINPALIRELKDCWRYQNVVASAQTRRRLWLETPCASAHPPFLLADAVHALLALYGDPRRVRRLRHIAQIALEVAYGSARLRTNSHPEGVSSRDGARNRLYGDVERALEDALAAWAAAQHPAGATYVRLVRMGGENIQAVLETVRHPVALAAALETALATTR